MSKTVDLTKTSSTEEAVVEIITQDEILRAQLLDVLTQRVQPKAFSSGNTGLYGNLTLKAPDARALGIHVPAGGKVVMSIQAVVWDPANGKNA